MLSQKIKDNITQLVKERLPLKGDTPTELASVGYNIITEIIGEACSIEASGDEGDISNEEYNEAYALAKKVANVV